MTTVACNGIELEVEQRGISTDPCIVLVRGLGTQLIDWPGNFLDGLVAAGFHVVLFDNRDVGLSSRFEGLPDLREIAAGRQAPPYTLLDMAEDIIGLMDSLDIRRAHLFAISMGGMVGQVLAASHGHRLLTFFSVMSSSSRRGLPGSTPAAAATLNAETDPAAGDEGIIEATVEGLRVCGSPGYPLTEEERYSIARARHARSYDPAGVVRQMAAVVAGADRIRLLESIRVPTLVIHGADDPLIPPAAGEDTANTIPGAELVIIEGMGHDLPPGLAPLMVEKIVAFTARHKAGAQ